MGMKRKYVAVLMGIMVATTSVPTMVYAEDSKTEAAADAAVLQIQAAYVLADDMPQDPELIIKRIG